MNGIKAIETQYKGYRFRSRLEARWAVFFDVAGIKWEYEPEGYDLGRHGRYLPDFYLILPDHPNYGDTGMFLEIKGERPTQNYLKKLGALAKGTKRHCVCVVGPPWGFDSIKACAGSTRLGKWRKSENEELRARYPDFERWFCSDAFWLTCDWHDCDTHAGVLAARSARFEHGESGSPIQKTVARTTNQVKSPERRVYECQRAEWNG